LHVRLAKRPVRIQPKPKLAPQKVIEREIKGRWRAGLEDLIRHGPRVNVCGHDRELKQERLLEGVSVIAVRMG
jgi:hypothetical protein